MERRDLIQNSMFMVMGGGLRILLGMVSIDPVVDTPWVPDGFVSSFVLADAHIIPRLGGNGP